MEKCKNCGGAVDDKGKCLACGTVNEMKLNNDDGKIIYGIPKELKGVPPINEYSKGKENV